jgi:hypothetical protein
MNISDAMGVIAGHHPACRALALTLVVGLGAALHSACRQRDREALAFLQKPRSARRFWRERILVWGAFVVFAFTSFIACDVLALIKRTVLS